jgi:hypothetical protein
MGDYWTLSSIEDVVLDLEQPLPSSGGYLWVAKLSGSRSLSRWSLSSWRFPKEARSPAHRDPNSSYGEGLAALACQSGRDRRDQYIHSDKSTNQRDRGSLLSAKNSSPGQNRKSCEFLQP